MIIANITSYIGQLDAVHYYCSYHEVANLKGSLPSKYYQGSSFNKHELVRELTDQKEINYINQKDGSMDGCGYEIGDKTNRFNSIDEIHKELKTIFPDEDIITYLEDTIFAEMLCIINGVDLKTSLFKNVFTTIPRSCYNDLISLDNLKIRCYHCKREYQLDDISMVVDYNRPLLRFLGKSDVDDHCDCFDLEWNIIL